MKRLDLPSITITPTHSIALSANTKEVFESLKNGCELPIPDEVALLSLL